MAVIAHEGGWRRYGKEGLVASVGVKGGERAKLGSDDDQTIRRLAANSFE